MRVQVAMISELAVQYRDRQNGTILSTDSISARRPEKCVSGCEGDCILPEGCPINGQLFVEIPWKQVEILTTAAEIDGQLAYAFCSII
jgi:hypothetical protein